MKKQPSLYILATGGTIASQSHQISGDSYGTAEIPIEKILAAIPDVQQYANIHYQQIAQIDSSQMTQKIWLQLAKRCNELLQQQDTDGVIITHGTDTIEETAYFLNLTVHSDKPVVLTGAMRPASSLSADGIKNLFNAIILAGDKNSIGKGVLVTLNDNIDQARDVTKTSVTSTASFQAPELGVLGYIHGLNAYYYKQSTKRHTINSEFNVNKLSALPKVDIVLAYTDSDASIIDLLVSNGTQGIISAGFGKGLQTPAVMKALINARNKGIHIVKSSKVTSGVVCREQELDDKYQFIAGNTLTVEKARILLSLALTVTKDDRDIQRIFDQY